MNIGQVSEMNDKLNQYLAVVENYPDLKANTQYLDLQNELSKIEEELQRARHKYNDEVTEYNTVIESVPSNIIASIFAFKHAELFQIEEHKRDNVKIDL
jgi:LemA protein